MNNSPQVNIKHLRDFVTDVSAANGSGFDRKEIQWEGISDPPLIVEVLSIAPGKQTDPIYYADQVELVICWRGRGTVSVEMQQSDGPGWEPRVVDAPDSAGIRIAPGDTLVLPKYALHSFTALAEERKTVQHPFPKAGQNPLLWSVEKLVLLLVRMPDMRGILPNGGVQNKDEPNSKIGSFSNGYPQVLSGDALTSYKRAIPDYLGFERDPALICVRSKIWGKEGLVAGGATDFAKPVFHFTAYTFIPSQENPEHFHPKSVELVLCWQGRADMTVRPSLNPDDAGNAKWYDAYERRELMEGDLVLVPKGALHWYATSGNEDLVLLALQTPHPVLHVLEDDSPGSTLDA
ncbi:cupin domain-containing protein [Paraburkholderia atlantica]|uniref:cupin domain-containing protein n=1 Tax=Paraburkholderia atlantica TaxID=2654982 RepID=UPI001619ACCF|nr:cupin domain-containing protein [Paraburkholderia atlantica]MBB5510922.1 quercetin dioxygenase-like cupin family protein [Paraburkholderia atlantica]